MAFMYHGRTTDELTDKEMIADVMMTQTKINDDIREILTRTGYFEKCLNEPTAYIDFQQIYNRYFTKTDNLGPEQLGKILFHISIFAKNTFDTEVLAILFNEALRKGHLNNNESFHRNCSLNNACLTYENFAHTHLSGLEFEQNITKCTHLRLIDKYKQYNNTVEDWYDFFMLPMDEKIKLLTNKKGD